MLVALRCLVSLPALSGAFMVLMGVGAVPLDPQMASVANVFMEPLSIPVKPFLAFLGTCKVLGVASLWGVGPMPRSIALAGLSIAAACGAYGHAMVGESPLPPIVYLCFMGAVCVLEGKKEPAKKE